MKKFLNVLSIISVLAVAQASFAAVGYVDYGYISKNYPLAQKYSANIKAKSNAIKTYAENQDKKINAAQTKAQKDKLRSEGLNQVKTKQQEIINLRKQYESELSANVVRASEQVRARKNLDMIIKADARVTGGVNCTMDVLNILKSVK